MLQLIRKTKCISFIFYINLKPFYTREQLIIRLMVRTIISRPCRPKKYHHHTLIVDTHNIFVTKGMVYHRSKTLNFGGNYTYLKNFQAFLALVKHACGFLLWEFWLWKKSLKMIISRKSLNFQLSSKNLEAQCLVWLDDTFASGVPFLWDMRLLADF